MRERWAVVTGAGSGIGRQTALAFAEAGWYVVAAGRRPEPIEETARLCHAGGSTRAVARPCDVSDPASCATLALAVEDAEQIALVNSAGVASFGSVQEMDEESILAQIETNLTGTILATRALLPKMLECGIGDVVNVASIAATHPLPGSEVYAATKAGVLAFGKALALTVRLRGVRVATIVPGATDTPLWDPIGATPPRHAMLSARSVAVAIRDVVFSPRDRTYDEVVLTPPGGIL